MGRADEADAVVMAAAVADYTPAEGSRPQKIAKESATLTLTLTRTADILRDLGRRRGDRRLPVLIGFAAETRGVVARARAKLTSKGADLIVANDVSRADAGFEVETNVATLVAAGGATDLPLQSKRDLARAILDRLRDMLAERAAPVDTSDHERP